MSSGPLVVVLPFCMKDAHILAKGLQWQVDIGARWSNCVLPHDSTVSREWTERVRAVAGRVFANVFEVTYPNPPNGYWPPNQAWQQSAKSMARGNSPWLWMEADMVPIVKDWIQVLDEAYRQCRRPFFGPIVEVLGHCNGTAIYPANAANRLPKAMRAEHDAWDVVMKPEMIHDCYDGGHLMQHAWTLNCGRLHPYDGGQEPEFRSRDSLRLLYPTAVTFHRDKTGTLIDRLRECRRPA